MLAVDVTAMPLAALIEAKVAVWLKVTLAPSAPTKPIKKPPVTVAAFNPS